MKSFIKLFAVFALAAALGCHKNDPNKDLKPIDPNTPPPKPASDVKGGGGPAQGDRPAPVIK